MERSNRERASNDLGLRYPLGTLAVGSLGPAGESVVRANSVGRLNWSGRRVGRAGA